MYTKPLKKGQTYNMSTTLNPALFKLKVSQAKCPIYLGQILPLIKEKLRTNQEDSLNHANLDSPFYLVKSISRLKSHSSKDGTKETYHLALMPVEWDEVKLSWGPCKEGSVSPHPFDISISSEELYDNFGVLTKATTNKGAPGAISAYIGDLFKKAKRYNEWLDKYQNIDFDKIFRGIAFKVFAKSPVSLTMEGKEDIFQSALLALGENNFLSKFDEKKASFINYIWGVFFNYLRNALKVYLNPQKHEKFLDVVEEGGDELSTEEQLGYLKEKTNPQQTPEDIVSVKDLLEDFKSYLEVQERGDILVKILEMLPEKYTQSEIAKKLGVSPATITKYVEKFIGYLKEYAIESENDLLLAAIKEGIARRNSSLKTAESIEQIRKIIDIYRDRAGQSERTADGEKEVLADRVPVGTTIKIKRKPLPSFEDLTKKVVQDPEKSSSQASKDVEAYLQDITSADELIEQDGKLIALKIQRKE